MVFVDFSLEQIECDEVGAYGKVCHGEKWLFTQRQMVVENLWRQCLL